MGSAQAIIHVRPAANDDALLIADIFKKAVLYSGPSFLNTEQVSAWVSAADNPEAFGKRVMQEEAFIAEVKAKPAGFVSLGKDGHLGFLYVHPDFQGIGIGGKLLAYVIRQAIKYGYNRMYAEVNDLSLPVLQKQGFVLTGRETVERKGVEIERYLVEMNLRG